MNIELDKNEIITFTQPFKFDELLEILNDDLADKVQSFNIFNECDDYVSGILAIELDYTENYLKKDLERIAGYYKLPIRKKKKNEIIADIIDFESNSDNLLLTARRKMLWENIYELIEDEYLNKYIIFN
jgi:hypothetical protein